MNLEPYTARANTIESLSQPASLGLCPALREAAIGSLLLRESPGRNLVGHAAATGLHGHQEGRLR